MSITLHSLFYQLYQQTSALQLRLSKFNSLSLSTPFHFRFHDLIKWPFCSLLCYRYINSKQNGYHSSLIILFKMKTLFPIKFANTILSQLPKTCFAVLVMFNWIRRMLVVQLVQFVSWDFKSNKQTSFTSSKKILLMKVFLTASYLLSQKFFS